MEIWQEPIYTLQINKPQSSVSAIKAAHLNSDKIHNKQTADLDDSSTLHTEQRAPSLLMGKSCALFGLEYQYEITFTIPFHFGMECKGIGQEFVCVFAGGGVTLGQSKGAYGVLTPVNTDLSEENA